MNDDDDDDDDDSLSLWLTSGPIFDTLSYKFKFTNVYYKYDYTVIHSYDCFSNIS